MSIKNKIVTLIKREYWENKSAFLKAPLVLAFIMLVVALSSFSIFLYNGDQIINSIHQSNVGQLSDLSYGFVEDVFYVIASPLMLIMWLVIFNYFLSTLHNDRKDRSLLFWLSMPITHTESIIAKVIAGLIIAPIFTWICIIATEFICLILLTIVALLLGVEPISHLWPVVTIFSIWIKMLIAFYLQGLWLFPLFAWCMLASAYAKRSPFLTAILPIILIVIIEGLFFHNAYLSSAISLCFHEAVAIWGVLFQTDYSNVFFGLFASIHLVYGLVIGGIFCILAGILRFRCFRFD